jgi:hypothetical protein
MKPTTEYFSICFKIQSSEYFLIWVSAETDKLVLSAKNKLAAFISFDELLIFAKEKELSIEPEETTLYDFDRLSAWMKKPELENFDCEVFLNIWNMLTDIEVALGSKLKEPSGADLVYDKLFTGSNIVGVTPPGEHYIPKWVEGEIEIMISVFNEGLKTLNSSIEYAT